MKVSIEELEIGDEIIISSHSELKYMRVLSKPSISPTKKNWWNGTPKWKNIKCAINKTRKKSPYTDVEYLAFDLNPDDLNTTIYKDLTGRDIWLVKKAPKI